MVRKVKSDSIKLDDVVIETDSGKEFTVAEIKHSELTKSITPKYDLSWYVKWAASAFILVAVGFRTVGPDWQFEDLLFSLLGTLGWAWVGILWEDKALIILNSVLAFLLSSGLLRLFLV
jgi:hypothetical protein